VLLYNSFCQQRFAREESAASAGGLSALFDAHRHSVGLARKRLLPFIDQRGVISQS
jgi:hypothetical protein